MSRRQEISNNLVLVQEKIVKAAVGANRSPEEITLIAVTKTYPHEDVEIIKELGISNFGENRDAEGAEKSKEVDGIWHFQGQIQSNKLKSITSWAHVIHSLIFITNASGFSKFRRILNSSPLVKLCAFIACLIAAVNPVQKFGGRILNCWTDSI